MSSNDAHFMDDSSPIDTELPTQPQFLYSAETELTQTGTEGYDKLEGTDGNDFLYGLGGSDKLYGNGGNDFISGGSGNDTIQGGTGVDQAFGGSGNDFITNSERAVGGAGNDTLIGNVDTTYTLIGGKGNDWIEGYGNDTLRGGSGNDMLISLGNHDSVLGGVGDDTLVVVGSLGQGTRLLGGDGNDLLAGNHNDQMLFGGTGSDTFFFGANVLFRYSDLVETVRTGHDRIVDFELDNDVISIDTRLASNFSELSIEQVGSTTVITLAEDSTITLNNTDAASLTSAHFSFDASTEHSSSFSFSPQSIDKRLGFSSADDQIVESWGIREFKYTGGGDGDDTVIVTGVSTGGAGEDIFVFQTYGSTPRYITDYQVGVDNLRVAVEVAREGLNIDASAYDVDIAQDGDNTIVTINGRTMILLDVNAADISIANDISFSIHTANFRDIDHEVFVGGDGDDTLIGRKGNDKLSGGKGDDILIGGEHGDVLKGEDGNDILIAGQDDADEFNKDILNGGNGDDQLYAGLGSDLLIGGQGSDTFYIGDWFAYTEGVYHEQLVVNNNAVFGDYDHTIRDFNAAEDALVISHRVFGSEDLDLSSLQFTQSGSNVVLSIDDAHTFTLKNTEASEFNAENVEFILKGADVVGTDFNDHIEGLKSDGIALDGGKGNDTLQGQRGNDTLTGGEGSDTFLFQFYDWSGTYTERLNNDFGHDTITDFEVNNDTIAFNLHDATLSYSQLQITQQGDDTVIEATVGNTFFDEGPFTITLNNTDAANITEDHFTFV
ncbi:calcium-binding protein [Enterovibrio calviensis]|uniref:calcium-binding protein n=1 Tax=Enterovibrio calviensis TaxID=91359 RepID=UPI000484FE66|nr:calcium-binding protein [Enterovibrio calviensis]